MSLLTLRSLEDGDIPLFKEWLYKQHVMKWYKQPEEWLDEVNGRLSAFSFIKHFIAVCDGRPIGFCQYYSCIDGGEDWYGEIPLEGTYSIDYLIGEEEYLHKGLGKEMITQLVKEVFSLEESKRIIVQPEEENVNSCKVLLACGFSYDPNNELYYLAGIIR